MHNRRQFLKGSLLFGAALGAPNLLSACSDSGTATSASGEVVFADYGGAVGEARRKVFFSPFEEATGIKVITPSADPARFLMMAKRGSSQWDTIDADNWLVAQYYNERILQELPDWVARTDYVEPPYIDYATAGYNQSFNIGYSTTLLSGAEPSSWVDFWDVRKFPGKRAIPGFSSAIAEAALLADGVAPRALYPLDFDRAFAKLDELRSSALIYKDYGEGQQMLVAESVSMALLPNGRVQQLIDGGEPIDITWNHALLEKWVGAPVPRGAPNAENIFNLLDFMVDAGRQTQFAELTGYGPAMSEAYDDMDPALAAKLPGSPEHVAVAAEIDAGIIATQLDEYNTRYVEWLGS